MKVTVPDLDQSAAVPYLVIGEGNVNLLANQLSSCRRDVVDPHFFSGVQAPKCDSFA